MKQIKFNLFCIVLALSAIPMLVNAQAPQLINYQGNLIDNGTPVTGPVNITFSIFDVETAGTSLWTETQSGVNVANGVFQVLLGGAAAFPANLFTSDGDRFLEVSVGGTPLSPRYQFTSTAYALSAQMAEEVKPGEVVTSLNNLEDDVTLAAGSNVSITEAGNVITISSADVAPQPIMTRIHYNGSTTDNTITSPYELLRTIGSFTKVSADSDIEINWIDHVNIVGGGFVEFQVRINDLKDNGSASTSYENTSGGAAVVYAENSPVSVFTVFKNLPAGEHTVSIWNRGGGATSCTLNYVNFGHDVFVKEVFQTTGVPSTSNSPTVQNDNYEGGVEK